MFKRSLVAMFLALFLFPTSLRAADLLVLGDSLSAGYGLSPGGSWVDLMQNRIDSKGLDLRVVNASISGETSSGGLSRLPDLLETHAPNIVLLELGANDGLRGTPLKIIERNLDQMAAQIEDAGAQLVVIGIRLPPNYGPRYTEAFFDLFGSLAKQYRAVHVPFLLEGVATDWSLMQPDGLHPTADAQPIILDTVWNDIESLLGIDEKKPIN